MKKLLFIYNPKSGSGKIAKKVDKITAVFSSAGYETEVYPTTAPLDGQNKVLSDGLSYDRIVVAGGDGMMSELVGAVMRLDRPVEVGYIPTGTANDFAHSHGISKKPLKAAKIAVSDNIKAVDVGQFNENYFAYVSASGFGTKASYLTNQKSKNRWKFLAYLAYALKDLSKKRMRENTKKMTIVTDNEVFEGEFVFVAVSNSFSIAGMKNLTDKTSVLDDGKLEGILLPFPKNLKKWTLLLKAFFTRNYHLPGLMFTSSKKFEITSQPASWTLDGENGGEHEKITILAHQSALHIALPKKKKNK